jgi:hypothetical protein
MVGEPHSRAALPIDRDHRMVGEPHSRAALQDSSPD